MPNARLLVLILGLTLAFPMAGCTMAPGALRPVASKGEALASGYQSQQVSPNPNLQARRRIREELERGVPDYSPHVESLSVWPIARGLRYAFRARVRVIGFAGPSVPLLFRVEGTYDPRQDRVTETSRTSITRQSRR